MARRGRKSELDAAISSDGVLTAISPTTAIFSPISIYGPPDTGWIDDIVEPDLKPEPPASEVSESNLAVESEIALSVRPVTDCDVDRLWDWVRQDEDRGLEFLGFQPKTAREVYGHFAQNFTDNPSAAAFAIDELEIHVGFALFNPIHQLPFQAVTHIYLAASVRGRVGEVVQQLLRICDDRYPGLSLVIVTPDERRMRLCRRAGFTVSYVLTRPAGGT